MCEVFCAICSYRPADRAGRASSVNTSKGARLKECGLPARRVTDAPRQLVIASKIEGGGRMSGDRARALQRVYDRADTAAQ